jgi:hypothetical protein
LFEFDFIRFLICIDIEQISNKTLNATRNNETNTSRQEEILSLGENTNGKENIAVVLSDLIFCF